MSAGKIVFGRLNGATSAENRIYPLKLPQGCTYPAVRYQRITGAPLHAMGTDSGVTRLRVQVDAWAETYAEVLTLAEEIKARLSRFKGTVSGVEVQDCVLENQMDLEEDEKWRVMLDFRITVKDN